MRRHKTQAFVFWLFIALAAAGVVVQITNPNMYIPIILAAIVFLLYKFPPKRLAAKSKYPKVKPSRNTAAKMAAKANTSRKASPSPKRKQYPFQVIDGQKGKHDPNDELPKYH